MTTPVALSRARSDQRVPTTVPLADAFDSAAGADSECVSPLVEDDDDLSFDLAMDSLYNEFYGSDDELATLGEGYVVDTGAVRTGAVDTPTALQQLQLPAGHPMGSPEASTTAKAPYHGTADVDAGCVGGLDDVCLDDLHAMCLGDLDHPDDLDLGDLGDEGLDLDLGDLGDLGLDLGSWTWTA